MTDLLRQHAGAVALLLFVVLPLVLVARHVHRTHVGRRVSQDDFPGPAVDAAYERGRRKREEEIDVA